MKPPTRIGVTSFTTSTSAGRSNARCSARRTRGSSSGFFLVLTQTALNDALIELRGRHAGRRLGLARRHRIADAGVIDPARQDRRAELGRERNAW